MKITPLDIRQMTFRTAFRGLDSKEVRFFLESLADEIEGILKERVGAQERLEEQERTISELKKKEGTLNNTLIAAQKIIEEMKAAAQKEGELIVRQAEVRAEEIAQAAAKEVTRLQGELLNLQRQRDLFIEKVKSLMRSFEKTLEWESGINE
ncbi:MAG TPA: DivIVA domain-containing protein [Candidatus Manganitrophaceae bacterium]|nr:DivIVA domain-containing protein [Candidatus Manganitrophaceae bacterium]